MFPSLRGIRLNPGYLRQQDLNPCRFISGGFLPMLRHWPWKYIQYYLWPLPRLAKNPLRKNCFAHTGEPDLREFWCGGRGLADARQGQQGKRRQIRPPGCGTDSNPVALGHMVMALTVALYGKTVHLSTAKYRFFRNLTHKSTFTLRNIITLRLLTTRGFPPSRAGMRGLCRSFRPRSGPSALFATPSALTAV